jgi:hypothetical protein
VKVELGCERGEFVMVGTVQADPGNSALQLAEAPEGL